MNIALIALSRPLSPPSIPLSHPSPAIVWPLLPPLSSSHHRQLWAIFPSTISSFFFSLDASGGHKFTRERRGGGGVAVYLSNNHHHGAENPMNQCRSSRGLWDREGGWRGRRAGVNIVMISPEFRSSGPMRRESDRERKRGRREREQLLSCHRRQL